MATCRQISLQSTNLRATNLDVLHPTHIQTHPDAASCVSDVDGWGCSVGMGCAAHLAMRQQFAIVPTHDTSGSVTTAFATSASEAKWDGGGDGAGGMWGGVWRWDVAWGVEVGWGG